jgi:hypothetical protein
LACQPIGGSGKEYRDDDVCRDEEESVLPDDTFGVWLRGL